MPSVVLIQPLFPSPTIGELKLQSNDSTNIFYADEVVADNINLNYGDFAAIEEWGEKVWTHGMKCEAVAIDIDAATTVINGLFQDNIGELIQRDINYEIHIYLWYEEEEETQ